MTIIAKINEILKKANISKVNFAKYLGVSRQMVYNYLDNDDIDRWPKEKKSLLLKLFDVKEVEEIKDIIIDKEFLDKIDSKIYNRKVKNKDELLIGLEGFKKEEQEILTDIVFILKEMLNEDKTKQSYITLKYVYHFLQSMGNSKELKYMLAYVAKAAGFVKPVIYDFEDEEKQFIFESILYSAMTLYNNGGASRSKLMESHKKWEAEIEQKNVEKLSRTQELNTAKIQALKELGYTEINEQNAGEVFDKIAEIQARNVW